MAAINFPSSPTVGDSFTSNDILFKWDGTKWNAQYSTFRTGSTPPSGPENGDLWWNSEKANLYIYYDDGDSAQWVTAARGVKGDQGDPGVVDFSAVDQSIIPDTDVTYDLGTSAKRWKDLYLSGSTINLGGATLTSDATTGAIALVPKPTVSVPNPTGVVISTSGGLATVVSTAGVVASNTIATAVASSVTPGIASNLTATTSSTSSNFKVPFLNTTANTTGSYTVLQDSSTNFTYNPSTNTLNNVVLGSSVTLPTLPAANRYTRGVVFADTSVSSSTSIGYGASSSNSYGVAVGYESYANSNYSITIGGNITANGTGSIIIGSQTSDNSYSNTIILNASGQSFSAPSSGFYATNVTSATASNVLYYDTSTNKITYGAAPSGGGGGSLNDLSDVVISSPSAGQVLTFDGTYWVNTGGGAPPSGAVTSGTGVTSVSSQFGPNQSGGQLISFSTAQQAETFYDALTQNLTALSAITSVSNSITVFIAVQAQSSSWGGPSAVSATYSGVSTGTLSYSPGNNYLGFNGYLSTGPGSGSGNWTYRDDALGWFNQVSGYTVSGGNTVTVDLNSSTGTDVYATAANVDPVPIQLRVASYNYTNFTNELTIFTGVTLSGSGPSSPYQFSFTYTNIEAAFSTSSNYLALAGAFVLPT